MKEIKILILFSFILLPSVVSAAAPSNLKDLIIKFMNLISLLIPVAMSLAVLGFIWGLVMYIWSGGNEEKRKEGRKFIVWGIIALFVMVSIWGLVGMLNSTIFGSGSGVNIPATSGSLSPVYSM